MAANRDESDHDVSDEEIGFSSEEEKEIERELADIPFEELQRARSDGSHTARPGRGANVKLGRANKNRPSELSSKMPVGRFREVIQAPKKVVRDPRFESLCGKLDPEGFRKRYNFLYDVELPAEKEKLQKLIKKSKDANVIEELKNHISWIDKQLKSAPRRTAESGIISEHVKKEREAAKQGKRPYYLKKCFSLSLSLSLSLHTHTHTEESWGINLSTCSLKLILFFRQLKFDKGSWCRSLTTLRHKANLTHLLRKGGVRTPRKITDLFHTVDLLKVFKTAEIIHVLHVRDVDCVKSVECCDSKGASPPRVRVTSRMPTNM